MVKAIETTYAGCRFRSRLEARWAVFFDALSVEWTYELEGYELASGSRYLPDFFLPEFSKWIEVKAGLSHITHDEWQRMQDFGNEVAMPESKFSIIFSIPEPRKKPSPLIRSVAWIGPMPDGMVPRDDEGGPTPSTSGFSYVGSPDLVDGCGHVFAGFCTAMWVLGGSREIDQALSAARSARFEHGQSGAVL